MRMIAILFGLTVMVVLAYAASTMIASVGARRRGALESGGTWRARHYGEGGARVVAVALMSDDHRVLDEHVVERIPDADPAWEERFLRAMGTAEERAFHLNATMPNGDQ